MGDPDKPCRIGYLLPQYLGTVRIYHTQEMGWDVSNSESFCEWMSRIRE